MISRIIRGAFVLLSCLVLNSCGFYSFSEGSIPPDVKTVSIARFQNNALMVAPILATTLTEALQDKFSRQTRLNEVRENGDYSFEGEITNYVSTAASISGGEYAQLNRLSISVRVRFTNSMDPSQSYDKTFTRYADYDSNKLLQSVEGSLIPEIVDQLVNDIYNEATSNW